MKRIILSAVTTDAQGTRTPTVPAATTSWVCIADFPQRNRMLVKATLPDGTAKTANTVADITLEQTEDGVQRQVDVNAEALTAAQRDNIKTLLTNAGFDVSRFDGDGIDDRTKLLRFILRRLAGWRDISWRELLDGWDA